MRPRPGWGSGMKQQTSNIEVAVVGGGPAGLSAAIEVAKAGASVLLLDKNRRPGGQLFKQVHKFFGSKAHYAGVRGIDIGSQLCEEAERSGVEIWLNTTVWGFFADHGLAVLKDGLSQQINAKKIILATAAYENSLSFPGWTLPGVLTAGALQTMMNIHRVLPGKRILMVGAGNVGLIVAYQILQAGVRVAAVIEAQDQIGGYAVHAAKIRRSGVPILLSHTIREAHGLTKVEAATIVQVDGKSQPIGGTEKRLEVDAICLAVGLTPMTELAWMAGCRFTYIPELGGHVPLHDENMETTMPGVYVAGDVAGVEEATTSMEEGHLAGLAVAEALGYLSKGEAAEQKTAVLKRLNDLRLGTINEHRRRAQQLLRERINGVRQELREGIDDLRGGSEL